MKCFKMILPMLFLTYMFAYPQSIKAQFYTLSGAEGTGDTQEESCENAIANAYSAIGDIMLSLSPGVFMVDYEVFEEKAAAHIANPNTHDPVEWLCRVPFYYALSIDPGWEPDGWYRP